MGTNYYIEKNRKILTKINNILNDLPSFCSIFFIGIQNTTTPLTRLNYATDLKLFFNYLSVYEQPFMKKKIENYSTQELESVDSLLIERYLSYLTFYDNESGKSYNNSEVGKSRKLSTLRTFFAFFFNKGHISSNVAAKVKIPKIRSKDIIRLENDEVQEMLQTTETLSGFSVHQQKYNERFKLRDNAILSLFLGTGIRVSECVGLNVEDIDFTSKSFRIIRKGGNQIILYLSDELIDILYDYINYRNKLNADKNENALFLTLQNKRMGVRSMENLVKKYARVVTPLKNISPHKLRSTYGTNLYRATKDIYVVADVLGHKDVNTTKKHYAAISEDIRKEASQKVKLRDN